MAMRLTMHLPTDVAPRRLYRYAYGKAERVADAMTWPAITVEVTARVEEARNLAAHAWVHYLPVVQRERLVGVTCVCDLANAPGDRLVAQHMAAGAVASLGLATSIADAADVFFTRGYDGLPVTSARRPIGFLTLGDLVRAEWIEPGRRPLCRTCSSRRHLTRAVGDVSFCRDCAARGGRASDDPYDDLGGGD